MDRLLGVAGIVHAQRRPGAVGEVPPERIVAGGALEQVAERDALQLVAAQRLRGVDGQAQLSLAVHAGDPQLADAAGAGGSTRPPASSLRSAERGGCRRLAVRAASRFQPGMHGEGATRNLDAHERFRRRRHRATGPRRAHRGAREIDLEPAPATGRAWGRRARRLPESHRSPQTARARGTADAAGEAGACTERHAAVAGHGLEVGPAAERIEDQPVGAHALGRRSASGRCSARAIEATNARRRLESLITRSPPSDQRSAQRRRRSDRRRTAAAGRERARRMPPARQARRPIRRPPSALGRLDADQAAAQPAGRSGGPAAARTGGPGSVGAKRRTGP